MKHRRRPFPTVAHEIRNSERAVAASKTTHGNRRPLPKVEIAVFRARRFVTPWIPTLTFSRSECCPMILRFGRERFADPTGVSRSLRIADIHGPVQRQRHLREHTAK